MNASAEAADQIVRMSLNGVEVAAKITGKGAEKLTKLIIYIMQNQTQTKGKARLSQMLKSGKGLKIFEVSDKDLAKFCSAAKKYGVEGAKETLEFISGRVQKQREKYFAF